jgi:hypothetical protein
MVFRGKKQIFVKTIAEWGNVRIFAATEFATLPVERPANQGRSF